MDANRHRLFSELANEVVQQLPTKLRIRGHCSKQNDKVISQSVYLWCYLIGDFDKTKPYQSLRARMNSWLAFVRTHDFSEILKLYDQIFDLVVNETYADYDGFKRHLAWNFGPGIEQALSPFNHFLVRWFCCGTVQDAKAVTTICRFFKKLPLEMPDLKDLALDQYLECEQSLARRSLDESLLFDLNRIMRRWLKKLSFTDLVPSHGPGVVAEVGRDKELKYFLLSSDAKLRSCLRPINHFNNDYVQEYFPTQGTFKLERISRVIFVPKSYKALRTISAEPATLQYIQQGVKDIVYDYIRRHRYLSKRFPLSDQDQNKDLARIGAFTGQLATIDLSSASDLVGYDLVRAVFKGTSLYPLLIGTRSSQTSLPNGELVPLLKFAPMGSALCFPIETLVFGCVCELCRERYPQDWVSYDTYSTFGDDIICPTKSVERIIIILESLGFRVNKEKSFIRGNFRESCGGEYFYGQDITPVYCRISPISFSGSRAKAHVQLCDLANYSQEREFRYLRLGALHLLKTSYKRDLQPLFVDTYERSPMVFSLNPTNIHLKDRWNEPLQRKEFLCGSVLPVSGTNPSAGRFEYFDRLITMAKRGHNLPTLRHLEKYIGQDLGVHDTVLRRTWRGI